MPSLYSATLTLMRGRLGWSSEDEREEGNKCSRIEEEVKVGLLLPLFTRVPLLPFLFVLLPLSHSCVIWFTAMASLLPTFDVLHALLFHAHSKSTLCGPAVCCQEGTAKLWAGMCVIPEVKGSVWTSGHCATFLACPGEWGIAVLLIAVCATAAKHKLDWDCLSGHLLETHYENRSETDAWLEVLSLLNCRNYLWKVLSLLYFL